MAGVLEVNGTFILYIRGLYGFIFIGSYIYIMFLYT